MPCKCAFKCKICCKVDTEVGEKKYHSIFIYVIDNQHRYVALCPQWIEIHWCARGFRWLWNITFEGLLRFRFFLRNFRICQVSRVLSLPKATIWIHSLIWSKITAFVLVRKTSFQYWTDVSSSRWSICRHRSAGCVLSAIEGTSFAPRFARTSNSSPCHESVPERAEWFNFSTVTIYLCHDEVVFIRSLPYVRTM